MRGQVSIEYLFLLSLVGVAIIIVLAAQQPLFSQQKEFQAALNSLLRNVTNPTFTSLGSSNSQPAQTGGAKAGGLQIEMDSPGPYFSGQPGIFWVRIWNKENSTARIARIAVSLKNQQSQNVPVGPQIPDNSTIVFLRTFSQQFTSNSTGSHLVMVSIFDDAGNVITTSSSSFWVG